MLRERCGLRDACLPLKIQSEATDWAALSIAANVSCRNTQASFHERVHGRVQASVAPSDWRKSLADGLGVQHCGKHALSL